jgi:hypothetical protein
MIGQSKLTAIPRTHVVAALSQLRQEWQEAADGQSLTDIDGNVALLLADVAMAVGLNTLEQVQVFGADLAHKIDTVLTTPAFGGNGRQ